MDSFIALLTGVVVLATAIFGFLMRLNRDVQEIHVMVNSRMEEALKRIDQLYETLQDEGIEPPRNPARD